MAVALFDLGGVLFRYDPDTRWRAFAEISGLPATEVHKRLSASGYTRACDEGRLRGRAAYEAGIRTLGTRVSLERFTHAWVSAFRPDEALLALAVALKATTPVALLTNNSDLVRAGLEARWPAVLDPFMPRIFSADLGLAKPDPRAYLRAAELLGHPPPEILVIDDGPSNTAVAASLGFPAVTYTTPAALAVALATRGLL